MHSFKDRVSVFCSFLRWFRLFITSDQVFFIVGILFLRCERVVSMYYCCFSSFIWSLYSRVKKYSQNKWHLVAKFGTKLANLLQRSSLPYVSHIVGGGVISFMFLLLDAVFLCYRDVQRCKSQKSILICHWCRQQLYLFMYAFNLDWEV